MTSRLMILSGGQSGVDRAALDVAIARGIAWGGWCPQGGWAEDMPDPPGLLARYPHLRETPSRDPAQRTEWNVRDADVCLVLVDAGGTRVSGGTALAEQLAAQYGKPVLVVDVDAKDAAAQIRRWVAAQLAARKDNAPLRLAVGGPRESEAPGIYTKARAVLQRALPGRRSRARTILLIALALLLVWGVAAYVLLPLAWRHYEHQRGLAGLSMVTRTAQGIPGDAINVGLVGARNDVLCAMHAAGWYPADPVTLRSSLEIIGSVVLRRPYRDAPVSNLYYEGRREDLAFEKPAGTSAARRHHVRFWQVLGHGAEGRPVWLGAATFDRGVGLSHYTGQVTHHIAPDIDAERDALIADLAAAQVVTAVYEVSGVGPTFSARNGGGDRYFTDGEIRIARLVAGCDTTTESPALLASPPLVVLKNAAWRAAVAPLLAAVAAPE